MMPARCGLIKTEVSGGAVEKESVKLESLGEMVSLSAAVMGQDGQVQDRLRRLATSA